MKVKILNILFAAFALIYSSLGFPQQIYQEEFIRFYQGLPSDIVEKTQTDSKGFLYVSTQRGLCLYDGYRFITNSSVKPGISGLHWSNGNFYFHDSKYGLATLASIHEKPRSIVKNNYEDIYPNNDHFDNIFVDSQNRIWSTDFNNIKFKLGREKIKSFVFDKKNNNAGNAVSFIESSPDQILAFTHNGLFIWSKQKNSFERSPNLLLGNSSLTGAFKPDSNRIFCAFADGRIAVLEINSQKVTYLPKLPNSEVVTGFGMLANKDLIVNSKQNVYILNSGNSKFRSVFTASGSQINHVLTDKRTHLIWVSTNKGLVKLTPVEAIKSYEIPQKSFSGNKVLAIEQASDNSIWILDSKGKIWSFRNFEIWKDFSTKPVDIKFSNLNFSRNSTLLPSDQGLFIVRNNEFEKLPLDGLPKGKIKKAIITTKGDLWILLNGFPPQRYSWPQLKKYESDFKNTSEFWTENTWNDIIENTDGTVWIVGWSPKSYGMIYFNSLKNVFIDNSDGGQNSDRRKFFGDYVNRIALAKNNELLFSGYGGFNFVKANGDIKSLIDINNYPIANGRIEGIALDNRDNVVFATGDGLHVYHPKSDKVHPHFAGRWFANR